MSWVEALYNKSKDNAFGYLMSLVALILGSVYVQTFISLAFSLFVAVYFANNSSTTFLFWFIAVVYLLILVMIAYLNNRKRKKKVESDSLVEVSRELQKMIVSRMKALEYQNSVQINQLGGPNDITLEREADVLCEVLYKTLSKLLSNDDIEIVLWISICDNNQDYATPLSFGLKDIDLPTWAKRMYSFSEDNHYRIVDCFTENQTHLFLNKTQCKKELSFRSEKDRDECKTHQYIAIPVRKQGGVTKGVIQIRTFADNVFPDDLGRVREIIRNYISPFSAFLELAIVESVYFHEVIAAYEAKKVKTFKTTISI